MEPLEATSEVEISQRERIISLEVQSFVFMAENTSVHELAEKRTRFFYFQLLTRQSVAGIPNAYKSGTQRRLN